MSERLPKTQKTPKGHEIPVPTKEGVFQVPEEAAEPLEKKSSPGRMEK